MGAAKIQLYDRSVSPFGITWEDWTAIWCRWMLSIPKENNPSLDETGKYCSINQNNDHVWFLTGTFGNLKPVVRKCKIPRGKAILFPVLVKEDSLAEDSDLTTDSDLINRSNAATNNVISMKAIIDGQNIPLIEDHRVQSIVFDLTFPYDNVYDVKPGLTRSVCDGYWIFMKPLIPGEHRIHFIGENLLDELYTINQLQNTEIFTQIRDNISRNHTFKLDVTYDIVITAN